MQPEIGAGSIVPHDRLIGGVLRRQHRDRPGQTAFVTLQRSWTFAEADDAANRIAQGLASLGVGTGDRVACLTRHGVESTLLIVAASRLGAVCAPVNWRLAGPEVEYVVHHAEARVLLVDDEFVSLLAGRQLPLLRLTLSTDGGPSGFHDWLQGFDPIDPMRDGLPEDTALQLYSSGTTGLPKGVELTHTNLLIACRVYAGTFGIDTDATMLNALPSFHIAGVQNAFTPMIEGGRTIFRPQFDAPDAIATIASDGITHAFLVPSMILFMLQHESAASADFTSLRGVSYGGSPIAETLLAEAQRVFGCGLLQSYGMTEATGTMTWLLQRDHVSERLRSAGTPAPGVQVRVVDAASGVDRAEGDVGEVWVRSRQNMLGYWRNADATAAAFPEGRDVQGGWMRTGDAGYRRHGCLWIHDRIKDMIISGGENIYPAEIENVLAAHPAVSECAIVGVPDARWGEAVKACVVVRAGHSAEAAEIIDWLRERLAHFKCPKSVDFFDSLPRNPSGKLLKRMLRQPYWEGRERQVS